MDRNYKCTPSVQALDPLPGRHHQGTKLQTMHVGCPGPTTTNPWTCKFRSYLLPSYSTDIWKTIKKSEIWYASRLKANTSIVQALDPPPTHLDNTVKVPNFKQCTSDAQGPPPPTPEHVSSGPIFCLHIRQISERKTIKKSEIWHNSRVKPNASIVQALDPPPTHLDDYQST